MTEPRHWLKITLPPIDYQYMIYYSAPKQKATKKSLDEVDPELLRTFEKLGIPLSEQKQLAGVAVDAVFDSVSVATTYKERLKKRSEEHTSELQSQFHLVCRLLLEKKKKKNKKNIHITNKQQPNKQHL